MYEKPQLERFGSLRELTQQGWNARQFDAFFIIGNVAVPIDIGKTRTS